MPTMKENFLRLLRNENPKWLGDPWSCFNQNPNFRPCIFDAVTLMLGSPQPGETKKNAWGVTMTWPIGQPGSIPHVTKENCVIKDITNWKDFVEFPSLDNLNWPLVDIMFPNIDRENLLVMAPSFLGMFEFSHYMMGFEEALMNYLIEPEAMFELLSAYTDWKIAAVTQVIDHMKPDIIHSHDDWGNKKSLFLPPTVWRELIKPHYERFYGYIKSRGVLIQHHNDSVSHEICEDMVDIGMDMWQGVIPQNDIPGIIERTEGKLCVMGGFDMQKIDFPTAKDEDIKEHVRWVIDTYMHLGSFIPCVTNVFPVYPNVDKAVNEELDRYGAIWAEKHFK